jgi:hypothetical protein
MLDKSPQTTIEIDSWCKTIRICFVVTVASTKPDTAFSFGIRTKNFLGGPVNHTRVDDRTGGENGKRHEFHHFFIPLNSVRDASL